MRMGNDCEDLVSRFTATRKRWTFERNPSEPYASRIRSSPSGTTRPRRSASLVTHSVVGE